MAFSARRWFRHTSQTEPPVADGTNFYVNDDGDLVRRLADGTESVVGGAGEIAAAITAHEAEADPHPDYLTADS